MTTGNTKSAVVALIALILASAAFYVVAGTSYQAAEDGALALGSSALSVLLAVWFIERSSQRAEAERVSRLTEAAFQQLLVPLRRHLSLLQSMYNYALVKAPEHWPTSLNDFLGNAFPEVAVELDLDLDSPAEWIGGPLKWSTYLTLNMKEIHTELSDALTRYSHALSPEDIELLRKFRESTLIQISEQIASAPDFQRSRGYPVSSKLPSGFEDILRAHGVLFGQTVARANEVLNRGHQVEFSAVMFRVSGAPSA